jgi:hypothetical protein
MSHDCSVPYNGRPRTINATVNPPELNKGIAKLKEHSAEAIRKYVREGRRANKPGTKRELKHTFTEEHHSLEGAVQKKITSTTKRRSN